MRMSTMTIRRSRRLIRATGVGGGGGGGEGGRGGGGEEEKESENNYVVASNSQYPLILRFSYTPEWGYCEVYILLYPQGAEAVKYLLLCCP